MLQLLAGRGRFSLKINNVSGGGGGWRRSVQSFPEFFFSSDHQVFLFILLICIVFDKTETKQKKRLTNTKFYFLFSLSWVNTQGMMIAINLSVGLVRWNLSRSVSLLVPSFSSFVQLWNQTLGCQPNKTHSFELFVCFARWVLPGEFCWLTEDSNKF